MQIRTALRHGLTGFTHLFNAMSQLTGREPGVVGAALDDPDSWCGIIVDGRHVDPTVLRIALRCKRHDRFMLVTDAMPSVGAAEKSFSLQGRMIAVADGVLVDEDGTLAGSDIDMATTVRNAIQLLGVDLPEAVRMASQYPAEFLGLGGELGRIAPGYRANLVLADDRARHQGDVDRRTDADVTATLFNYSYHYTATHRPAGTQAAITEHRHRGRRHGRMDDRDDPGRCADPEGASTSPCSNRPRWTSSASARAPRRGCGGSSTASTSRNPSGCPRAMPRTSAASRSTAGRRNPASNATFIRSRRCSTTSP